MAGDRAQAQSWWRTAAAVSARETDAYVWVRADAALTHAQHALEWGMPEVARDNAHAAIEVAARCGLEDILAGAVAVREAVGDRETGRSPETAFASRGAL